MGIADIYYQKPVVPGQDVQQAQTQAFDALPQAQAQMMQVEAQKAATARQNAPINPLEQDLMDLMHDRITPEQLAAKHKAAGTFAGGGAATQMPGGASANQSGMTSMPQATMPASSLNRGPVSRQDYEAYMKDAQPLIKQPVNAADQLALQRLKNEGSLDVSKNRTSSNETIATGRNQTASDIADAKRLQKEEEIKIKRGDLERKTKADTERAKYHKDYLDYLNNKMRSYESIAKARGNNDPVLKALVAVANAAVGEHKGVVSQPINNLTEQGQKQAEESEKRAEAAVKAVQDHLEKTASEPQVQEQTTTKKGYTGAKQNAPTGSPQTGSPNQGTNTSKYKVGDTVDIGGGRRGRITGYGANGKLNVEPL